MRSSEAEGDRAKFKPVTAIFLLSKRAKSFAFAAPERVAAIRQKAVLAASFFIWVSHLGWMLR
jgi:hypothetical protein